MLNRRRKAIKNDLEERELFRRRAMFGFGIILLAILALVLRYLYLQVWQYPQFSARSEQNRIKIKAVEPNRGLIYDRNGELLADNRPAYRLELVPERVEDEAALLQRLGELVSLSPDQLQRYQRIKGNYRRFQGVPLRFSLTESELARFSVNQHRFAGVRVVPYLNRYYPHGELLTHIIGYVGRIDADDLDGLEPDNYRASTHIGKTGIEKYRELLLHGQAGVEQVEINVQGRVLRTLSRTDPVPGNDLILSIDIKLQQAAWEALGDAAGSVVAIDPRNGDILAMVSKPAFDPNWFVNGVSQAQYDQILNDPDRPLFNRSIRGAYEPGSTLKPFVALAGLEGRIVNVDTRIFSSGQFTLPNSSRPYRDWLRGGHGWVTIEGALEQSVNTYFYTLAADMGIDAMHDYLGQFGFGHTTGVDLLGESAGILPSREWKRRTHQLPWYPGETVIAAIGQGFNVITPLQLTAATAALAMDGLRFSPRLVIASRSGAEADTNWLEPLPLEAVSRLSEANWEAVKRGMLAVVHGSTGTARGIGVEAPYRIAGKTGTAQVFGLEEGEVYQEQEVARHLRHNALFVAYAPAQAPAIAVAVVAEHKGAGSRVAAPIARQVLDAYLLPEAQP